MKIVVSLNKLNVVNPSKDQLLELEKVTDKAVVREAVNGLTITADPATLYKVLYTLSCKYDVELV